MATGLVHFRTADEAAVAQQLQALGGIQVIVGAGRAAVAIDVVVQHAVERDPEGRL